MGHSQLLSQVTKLQENKHKERRWRWKGACHRKNCCGTWREGPEMICFAMVSFILSAKDDAALQPQPRKD